MPTYATPAGTPERRGKSRVRHRLHRWSEEKGGSHQSTRFQASFDAGPQQRVVFSAVIILVDQKDATSDGWPSGDMSPKDAT